VQPEIRFDDSLDSTSPCFMSNFGLVGERESKQHELINFQTKPSDTRKHEYSNKKYN